jgi:hypothetical protein
MVKYAKRKKEKKNDDVAICRQWDITDPIKAHLLIDSITANAAMAIASHLTHDNNQKLLTVSKFMKCCNEIA